MSEPGPGDAGGALTLFRGTEGPDVVETLTILAMPTARESHLGRCSLLLRGVGAVGTGPA